MHPIRFICTRRTKPAIALFRLCCAITLCFAFSGCSGQSEPANRSTQAQPAESDHEKMVSLLARIAEDAPSLDQIFLPENRPADQLAQAIRNLPPEQKDLRRLQLHFEMATAASKTGDEKEAIEQMEAAYALLPTVGRLLNERKIEEIIYRLGLLHMRYGETQNCCLRNTPESCIIPFQPAALHTEQEGSRNAIKYFTELLRRTEGKHDRAKWLLNIAYMTLGEYPDQVPEAYRIAPEFFFPGQPFPRFQNIAAKLGVNNFNGAGTVVVDDFDGDGHLDILTSSWSLQDGLRFFRSDGSGGFVDNTALANLKEMPGGINMVQADYDNDGDLDVYIMRGSWLGREGRIPNSLLNNDGTGTFTDVTFQSGLGKRHFPSHTASWADYDNDGDVDLFVGNENAYVKNQGNMHLRDPSPSQLFRNEGNGTFVDVAAIAGVENYRFVKGVSWGDYNQDRFPDLYVSNYGTANRLYRNNRDGTFTDVAADLQVDRPLLSFPTWFWDYNNDGLLDLYVSSYDGRKGSLDVIVRDTLDQPTTMSAPKLYRGIQGDRFEEVATDHGLTKIMFAMGGNYGDLDNDGFLDFYLGTGYPDYEALMPNVMYHNRAGKQFEDVTFAGGFGHLQKGHGIAFADLDGDGDQDVVTQMGGFYQSDDTNDLVFENPGFGNHWIQLKLAGTKSNRAAIGARIHVVIDEDGKQRSIYKFVNSGGSFGAGPLRQLIGLGSASRIDRVEVYWPMSDQTQVFTEVPLDSAFEITEGQPLLKRMNAREL